MIDANVHKGGNQAFSFLGQARLSGHAGTAHDRTIISADLNGDRRPDMQIELTGLRHLSTADFIL